MKPRSPKVSPKDDPEYLSQIRKRLPLTFRPDVWDRHPEELKKVITDIPVVFRASFIYVLSPPPPEGPGGRSGRPFP